MVRELAVLAFQLTGCSHLFNFFLTDGGSYV